MIDVVACGLVLSSVGWGGSVSCGLVVGWRLMEKRVERERVCMCIYVVGTLGDVQKQENLVASVAVFFHSHPIPISLVDQKLVLTVQ